MTLPCFWCKLDAGPDNSQGSEKMDFYRQYNGIDITLVGVRGKKYTFTYLWRRFTVNATNEDAAFKAAYDFLLKARM